MSGDGKMNELEKLRALLAGASAAPDRETSLAYLGAARAVGRRIREELKSAMISLAALEAHHVRAGEGEQVSLLSEKTS